MLNKLREFIRCYRLIHPGDKVVCAISGGPDSVALLFCLYLLRESLEISLSAAHFNHGLRGDESDRDERFVQDLCDRLEIPLTVGRGKVVAGKKGLEAAARDARYGFFETLTGKIATAHTADDNAETVIMHLVRGTGLKGLGGIAPENGPLIRPMLSVTRQDVLRFLSEYHLDFVTDSSNETDLFMRNRIRHHIVPLLQKENPRLAENLSAMALRLRKDEETLESLSCTEVLPDVITLRQMPYAIQSRVIAAFLRKNGLAEPEAAHIKSVQKLINSDNPSAKCILSDNVQISRCYNELVCDGTKQPLLSRKLSCPGEVTIDDIQICCSPAVSKANSPDVFTVLPKGTVVIRCRQAGDSIRLPGGTKSLKKLFIDKKIPASERCRIPVIADDVGVLGVYGFGANLDRLAFCDDAVEICFEHIG